MTKTQLEKPDYRLIAMDKTSDGILISNAQGKILYANSAFLKFYEIKNYAIINGEKWKGLILKGQEEAIRKAILSEFKSAGEVYGEITISVNETKKIAEISITRIEDGGIIITLRDSAQIQDIKREREALREQLHQAQKLEAIGRLAGGVAHDFNNILAAMNGYAEFLIEDLQDRGEQQQFAKNILTAGQQARDLVDKMLTFSRRDEGEMARIDLRSTVEETIMMLKASLPKTIVVRQKIPAEPIIITGNGMQLAQGLMNLCVNAKDAMTNERGILELAVEVLNDHNEYPDLPVLPSMPAEDYLPLVQIDEPAKAHTRLSLGGLVAGKPYYRLRVKDDGSGMSRLIMENIFEPFFTTKPVNEGTGLGLAMVHGVIAAHKGALVINSTIGKGTHFELLFPTDGKGDAQSASNNIAPAAPDMPDGHHVLLVEDDETVARMAITMLTRLGVEAEHVDGGHEALTVLKENPNVFELVITDQNMPDMTGTELIAAAQKEFPSLPFMILSGYSEERLQSFKDKHDNVKAILRKPITKDDLNAALNKVFKL